MDNLYGMLKSSNCLSMLNDNNFVVGPSKSSKEASIFTAKNFLKYCRLLGGSVKPEKAVGLSLLHIIAIEPRFKDGIILRCELPLRIKPTDNTHHVQPCNRNKDSTIPQIPDCTTSFLHGNKDSVITRITDSTTPFLHRKKNSVIPQTAHSTTSYHHVVLEKKPDKGAKLPPIKNKESGTSLPPMVVNDIKSFALLDAKFREDEERNLLNESIVMWAEEFIRDIRPTYSDAKLESCIIEKPTDDEVQNAVGGQEPEILTVLKQDKSTEVIMAPRPSGSKKSDAVTEEEVIEKKPVVSKLMKPENDVMFKREKEKGWRIRESYEIYKTKQANCSSTSVSPPSHCASEVATARSTASRHPPVKAVMSTRLLPNVRERAAEKIRRSKEAERRIRASFKTFVERQNEGRTRRALKEQ